MQEQMKTDAYTIPFSNKGSEGKECNDCDFFKTISKKTEEDQTVSKSSYTYKCEKNHYLINNRKNGDNSICDFWVKRQS